MDGSLKEKIQRLKKQVEEDIHWRFNSDQRFSRDGETSPDSIVEIVIELIDKAFKDDE